MRHERCDTVAPRHVRSAQRQRYIRALMSPNEKDSLKRQRPRGAGLLLSNLSRNAQTCRDTRRDCRVEMGFRNVL